MILINIFLLSVYGTRHDQQFNFHRNLDIFISSFNMSAPVIWFVTTIRVATASKMYARVSILYRKLLDCYPNKHFLSATYITIFFIKMNDTHLNFPFLVIFQVNIAKLYQYVDLKKSSTCSTCVIFYHTRYPDLDLETLW